MKILTLDCHGQVVIPIVDFLREEFRHEVFTAYNINDANSLLLEKSPFHCLIVDVTGPVDGLTDEEVNQTHEGWISGWIWLRNYILIEKPAFSARVIIFSTSQTLEILDKEDSSAKQRVRIVCKNGKINCVAALVAELEKISKLAL